MAAPVVALQDVTVVEGTAVALREVTWSLDHGDHAVILGPNGSGKTTVLRLLAGYRHPSRGTVEVLGHRLGAVDARALRRRIGFVSDALGALLHRPARIRHLLAAAVHAATRPTAAHLDDDSLRRAEAALHRAAVDHLAERRGTDVSEGEWKRVLLARALVTDPALLLLDEPFSGLDLAGRERFLAEVDRTLRAPGGPTGILVTHHLEEIPPSVTRALLLRGGRAVAAGPVAGTVTSRAVSETYGLDVEVTRAHGRFGAVLAAAGTPRAARAARGGRAAT